MSKIKSGSRKLTAIIRSKIRLRACKTENKGVVVMDMSLKLAVDQEWIKNFFSDPMMLQPSSGRAGANLQILGAVGIKHFKITQDAYAV